MITHHPNCNANYPEKVEDETAQQIIRETLDNDYWVDTCVDCGAFETNLPPENDPCWDDDKES